MGVQERALKLRPGSKILPSTVMRPVRHPGEA